ncbi:IS3 family transposase [Streptomyces sp. NPDC050703]|uniref:IS3 family transposase n=1 Tax=Streptomyces sp. NPDC050703 TaxID=3157218 RepID=UPI00343858C8
MRCPADLRRPRRDGRTDRTEHLLRRPFAPALGPQPARRGKSSTRYARSIPPSTANGVRRDHAALVRDGVRVARCTVERLMRQAGLRGVIASGPRAHVPPGPPRRFAVLPTWSSGSSAATAPNQLWVADIMIWRIDRFDQRRLHSELGHVTPAEHEAAHYATESSASLQKTSQLSAQPGASHRQSPRRSRSRAITRRPSVHRCTLRASDGTHGPSTPRISPAQCQLGSAAVDYTHSYR